MKQKFLPLLIAFYFSTTYSIGQISSGKILLGGSIGYAGNNNSEPSQPNSSSDYNNFYSNIQVGKFVKENTAAGLFLSYNYVENSYYSNPLNKSSDYGAGVFYRKYKSLSRNFYFFGEGDASYSYSKNKQSLYQNGTRVTNDIIVSNRGSLSFIPGISYSVWKKMQVELLMPNILSISYAHTNTKYFYTNPTSTVINEGNNFSANANLNSNFLSNFAIGFKFIL